MGSDRERVKCFSSNLFPISTVDLKKKKKKAVIIIHSLS